MLELRDVDLLTMNPMEAFDLLRELAKKVKEMI